MWCNNLRSTFYLKKQNVANKKYPKPRLNNVFLYIDVNNRPTDDREKSLI